jgi:hypothetical protein
MNRDPEDDVFVIRREGGIQGSEGSAIPRTPLLWATDDKLISIAIQVEE